MSDFRKAIGDSDEQPSNQPGPISFDDIAGADNLPAVPEFEEASFEEASFEEVSSTAASNLQSSDSLGNVEEAQIDEPQPGAPVKIKQGSKRKPILLAIVALGIVAIAVLMLSGGKKEPVDSSPPSVPAQTPQTVEPVAPSEETAVDGVAGDTAVDGVESTPSTTPSGGATSQTQVRGLITPKERAQGEKLLNQSEAWIKKADHPADGKTGKLRNNEKQMAALMSQELPFKVTTKNPKEGQVQIMLDREVGLCLLITTVGKKDVPMMRKVKIYVTGVSALRDNN